MPRATFTFWFGQPVIQNHREPLENQQNNATVLDAATFESLYLRLEKPVFNVVYRWLWNSAEAQDVTQEAFMNIWNARKRVDMNTVDALVFRSAVNLAANRKRVSKWRQLFSLEAAAHIPSKDSNASESIEKRQRDARIRKAVDALPEKLKSVVMLCEFSGLSTQAIADTLKIPAGTVSSRRSLAMAALEKELGPWENES
jgi:RNA polymerase sigma-70 factor, ECF subfamily